MADDGTALVAAAGASVHRRRRAAALGLPAETLTIFRIRPWNEPWFRPPGFQVMPEGPIGQGGRPRWM